MRRLIQALLLALPAPAIAAPEEVQVYMDELGEKGEVGLDVHANYVAEGSRTPDYPGQQLAVHRLRLTPEFSLGLGHGFEAGLYLPLATVGAGEPLRADGIKARLKWLAPHGEEGFYWGANLELGRVAHRLDENPWNGELKLIGGWRRGKWIAAVNGNIDFVVSGPNPGPVELEIASKLGYKLGRETVLGVESYNGMGPLRDLGHLPQREHTTYLTLDTRLGRWDLNAGIGRGYGTAGDQTVIKFVIGVPLGRGK
ncbi:MAG: hypothetical protein JSS36_07450 [Proteobacteria bacterium]|nr:hypothetical protein [Pseudomonadota bacterium]